MQLRNYLIFPFFINEMYKFYYIRIIFLFFIIYLNLFCFIRFFSFFK